MNNNESNYNLYNKSKLDERINYIDINCDENIIKGICRFLVIEETDLTNWIKGIKIEKINKCISEDVIDNKILEFLEKNKYDDAFNYIEFVHLTRLVHPIKILLPLSQLLITKNDFSDFLKKYDISFKNESDRISLYHNSIEKKLNDCLDIRLGNKEGYSDSCINGYIFDYNLKEERNDYYNNIKESGSECLRDLEEIFDYNLCNDFKSISNFYYVYCLAKFDDIIFDNKYYDFLSNQKYYIFNCLKYFIYKNNNIYFNSPIIRLKENLSCEIIKCKQVK